MSRLMVVEVPSYSCEFKGIREICELVRCRECKYAEVSLSPIKGLWCTRFGIKDMAMEDDDFCSKGERKDNDS